MSLKDQLIAILPPFRNEKVLIRQRQGTEDIIVEVCRTHCEYEADYDKIFEYFDTGKLYDTCNKIWNFLKHNLTYDAESGKDQSVKSPSAILHKGATVDCKHYSLFAAGILDALRTDIGGQWDWCFRFASDKSRSDVSHVFVVVFDKNKEIWIDPCLSNFDYKKTYLLEIDERPMSLYKISGVGDVAPAEEKTIIVDKQLAWQSFLTMVTLDIFSLKTLMNKYPNVTHGVVRQYCEQNGFDYGQLVNFLNS